MKKLSILLSVALSLILLVSLASTALADGGERRGHRIERIAIMGEGYLGYDEPYEMRVLPNGKILSRATGYGGIFGNLSGQLEADLRALVQLGPPGYLDGTRYDFSEDVEFTGPVTLLYCELQTANGPLYGTLSGRILGSATAYYLGDPMAGEIEFVGGVGTITLIITKGTGDLSAVVMGKLTMEQTDPFGQLMLVTGEILLRQ